MADIVLTKGQTEAEARFVQFLLDPHEHVFVLSGYSGTGKTTLINTLIDRLPDYMKQYKAANPNGIHYQVQLTATTNKAAENFGDITGMDVSTIHSFLGLRVVRDYETNQSVLRPKNPKDIKTGYLLFIDEASMINSDFLQLIFERTATCKIVFIGDPAQLSPVMCSNTPVFNAGFPEARLTEIVRQAAGNPIIELATQFRHTVNTGEWLDFWPDDKHVIHLDRDEFEQEVLKEFSRPDWKYKDSKVLTYTNHCAISYNNALREYVKGDPELQVGDYAVCNHFVQVGSYKIATDQLVQITCIEPDSEKHGVLGNWITVDHLVRAFCPKTRESKKALEKIAASQKNRPLLREIENWIDLRAAFAQTVAKSQGSTYDRVFIDLDDIKTCTSANLIARLLYVGVSRARLQCFITGDF